MSEALEDLENRVHSVIKDLFYWMKRGVYKDDVYIDPETKLPSIEVIKFQNRLEANKIHEEEILNLQIRIEDLDKLESIAESGKKSEYKKLGPKIIKKLKSCGIETLGHLIRYSDIELLHNSSLGRNSIEHIKNFLYGSGYSLARNPGEPINWDPELSFSENTKLNIKLESIDGFRTRAIFDTLDRNGIETIRDLLDYDEAKLMKISGIKDSNLNQIKKELEKLGLSLKK